MEKTITQKQPPTTSNVLSVFELGSLNDHHHNQNHNNSIVILNGSDNSENNINHDPNNNQTIDFINGKMMSNGCTIVTNTITNTSGKVLSFRLDDRAWSRATCVLGAQWGDEGKGKIVDLLASDQDVVCRCAVSYGFV